DKPDTPERRPAGADRQESAKPTVPDKLPERSVTGRILGPRGEAVKDSRVHLCARHGDRPLAEVAVAADGRFRLTFDPERLLGDEDAEAWRDGRLIATAPGYGPVWVRLGDVVHAGWEARLAGDEVVEGTLTTLEGKPAAGVEITLPRLEAWPTAEK